jgi:drug/metabolite transporter (DMT)-like permease
MSTHRTDRRIASRRVVAKTDPQLPRGVDPKVALALCVVYLVWSTTFFAMRISLNDYPPFFLCAIRFLLAGVLLFAYAFTTGAVRIDRRLLLDALVTGVFMVTLGNGMVVVAEQHVSSGIAALVVSSESVFVLLMALFYGRRLSAWQFAGSGLCVLGVVMLAAGTELRYSPIALLALLTASLAWAAGSMWSARHSSSGSVLTLVALQMLIGGAISLAMAWGLDERLAFSSAASANLAVLYLALFGSIAAFISYNYLIRKVSPSLATSYAYVNPAIAFVVGCIFDTDRFGFSTALSLLGILTGLWLIVRYEANTPAANAHPEYVAQTCASDPQPALANTRGE